MTKRLVVNVATKEFRFGQDRLKAALQRAGEPLFFWSYIPTGWPQHEDAPFAFRACALKFAADKGYETLLWLDSDIVPIAPLEPLWEMIEQDGYWISLSAYDGPLVMSAFGLSAAGDTANRFFDTGKLLGHGTAHYVSTPPHVLAERGRETSDTILVRQPFEIECSTKKPVITPPRPAVEWHRGQYVRHKGRIFQIDSDVVAHSDAPGEACYEVLACDEVRQRLERLCVRAAELEGR